MIRYYVGKTDNERTILAIKSQLERFMPPDKWPHEITIKDGIATSESTYLKPIERIIIEVDVKGDD